MTANSPSDEQMVEAIVCDYMSEDVIWCELYSKRRSFNVQFDDLRQVNYLMFTKDSNDMQVDNLLCK